MESFSCESCGSNYKSKSKLRKHQERIHDGLRAKTPKIQPAPDGLLILLRNGHGLSVKSKWIKLAPGRLLDRFLGSNVPARLLTRTLVEPISRDSSPTTTC